MTDATPAATRRHPLLVAAAATLLVAGLSYGLPDSAAATGVGLGFLTVTWLVALRRDVPGDSAHFGLSLGGLLDPVPLDPRRMARDSLVALGWALGVAAVLFPPFWLGWVLWWKPPHGFAPAPFPALGDEVLGQLLVIALPEEAFYRGYLQTALDDAWAARRRILGADLGPGLLVTSAIFALGHLATEVNPNRLAVFFPALVFGWLRIRTRGIGAPLVLHAMSNLFATWLVRSYGLGG